MHFDEAMWVALGSSYLLSSCGKRREQLLRKLSIQGQQNKSELEEARKLHEEAKSERSLKGLKRDAEEAKTIVANAKAAANRIREIAVQKAVETVARREAQAAAKIQASEVALVNELRQGRKPSCRCRT